MQLNNKVKSKNIRKLLNVATGCLLGTTAMTATTAIADENTPFFSGWDTDIAGLIYSEQDRVQAWEPAIATQKTFDNDNILGFKLVFDTLSGASPNGASISTNDQTFTRPSGSSSYTTKAGETPLDDTFKDTRVSFSTNFEHSLGRMNRMRWGGNISSEHDFFSAGLSNTFSHDFNKRNSTVSFGLSGEFDTITPEGGVRDPLSTMQPAKSGKGNVKTKSETKTIVEMLLGLTQVIDRNTIMVFNYGLSQSSGYHNDPYKITSVVDAQGQPIAQTGSSMGTYLYENRPDERIKNSFYSKIKHAFGEDSLDFSYRYMFDDWGVNSHTFDTHYRLNYSGWYLEPHVRYYMQNEADFYQYNISEAQYKNDYKGSLNNYLSSDYRLAKMWSSTLGINVGFKTPNGNKNSVRFEYYHQDGETNFPTLDAFIAQYTYSF